MFTSAGDETQRKKESLWLHHSLSGMSRLQTARYRKQKQRETKKKADEHANRERQRERQRRREKEREN